MKKLLDKNFIESNQAWISIKISFLFFWFSNMFVMISSVSVNCPYPVGICKLYHFTMLFNPIGKFFLIGLLILLGLLYLFEINMKVVTLFLFLLTSIVISYHESNGMFHHATIFSPIFAVQCFAYWQSYKDEKFDMNFFRVQYSLQIIAAYYTLAGISKISTSGLSWINSGGVFAIQIIKNYSFIYFETGAKEVLDKGYHIAQALLKNSYLIQYFLSISLFLELFCLLALSSNTIRLFWGIGLLMMHTGILVVMGIPFGVIAPIMVIFFFNPLFWLIVLFRKTKTLINSLIRHAY